MRMREISNLRTKNVAKVTSLLQSNAISQRRPVYGTLRCDENETLRRLWDISVTKCAVWEDDAFLLLHVRFQTCFDVILRKFAFSIVHFLLADLHIHPIYPCAIFGFGIISYIKFIKKT